MSHQLARAVDRRRPPAWIATAFLSLALFPAVLAAADWHVRIDDRDVTTDALPFVSGGQIFVDATRLAPQLHIAIRPMPSGITIVDRDGNEWHAQPGDSRLQSPLRAIDLGGPLRFDGRSLYLPITVLADITGDRVAVEPNTKTVFFSSVAPRREPAVSPQQQNIAVQETTGEGWQLFDIAKPRQEIAAEKREAQITQGVTPLLPPTHENVNVNVGVAAIQGGDYASEITATGTFNAIQTQLYTLITYGRAGAQYYSGHLGLFDPLRRRSFEAGDLFSDVWGLARGFRFGFEGLHQRPQFSLYIPDQRTPVRKTLGSLTDDIFLTRTFIAGGEVTTDGSWLARLNLHQEHFGFNLYSRHPSNRNADEFALTSRGDGGSAYINFFRGTTLQVNASRSGKGDDRIDLKSALIRIPVTRGADVTADRTQTDTRFGKTTANGVGFGLNTHGFLFRTRYLDLLSEPAGNTAPFKQRFVTGSIGYGFGSHGRIDLQSYHPILPAGSPSTQQLSATVQVTRHTLVDAVVNSAAIPGQPRQYRYRLQQDISPHYALSVEYGQIPAYQPETIMENGPDHPRFKVMLRKLWNVPTPVGGGEVVGVIVDDRGQPVGGVPVRLGNFVTITDMSGIYGFEHVPIGQYLMSLDEQALPAAYAPRDHQRTIDVSRGASEQVDWHLIKAAGTVQGYVYIDRNLNGRLDAGEALAGAVVTLDGRATVTAADGSFAFYNLLPGQYDVHLDTTHLPERVSPLSGTDARVGFPHGETMTVIFRLLQKPKPIEFQKVH